MSNYSLKDSSLKYAASFVRHRKFAFKSFLVSNFFSVISICSMLISNNINFWFQTLFIGVNLLFISVGWFFLAKLIDFDRKQFWKLYRGTPIYFESTDHDVKEWITENLKERDFYRLGANSGLLILRNAKDAVLIKLMTE